MVGELTRLLLSDSKTESLIGDQERSQGVTGFGGFNGCCYDTAGDECFVRMKIDTRAKAQHLELVEWDRSGLPGVTSRMSN